MSADGLIEDMDKQIEVSICCYFCGRPICLNDPYRGHEKCLEKERNPEWKGRLRVSIEIVNIDEEFMR